MDDTDKTQGQTQNQPQPRAGGVGTIVKEQERPVTSQVESNVSEFIEPSGSDAEPRIHDELEKIGVRHVPEFPKVGPEERKIGISPAKESVPVKTEPSGIVQIPMTKEEARQILKHKKPTDSIWGYAALKLKDFKKIMYKKLLRIKN